MTKFFRDRQGSVLIMIALTLPVLFGVLAFAVDLSNLYYNKNKIQMVADAAALGAVLSLPDQSAVATSALALVTQNAPSNFGTLAKTADVQLGIWNSTTRTFSVSSISPNAVQVLTHRTVAYGNPVTTYFGKFVGSPQLEVNAKSIAVRFGGACVRVLDPTATNAFFESGNGAATMNCPMQVNSSATSAARLQGSSSLTTTSTVCIVGGYSGNNWSPAPQTGCKSLADPLASVPEPTEPATACSVPSSSGTMTGDCTMSGTVSFGGAVTMQSGLYYLKNANVKVSNSSSLSGSGVIIFVDANSTLSLGGGGAISISAPTSGTYAGVLIFQSRSTPVATTLSINAGGSLSLNGTLYAPSATLSLGGNGEYSSSAQFGYLIADKLTLGGSSTFQFNAFPTSSSPRTLRIHTGLVT